MWPLLYQAESGILFANDVDELRRLVGLVESADVRIPGFADKAREFCVAVRSSGVLEGRRGNAREIQRLRNNADLLLLLLNAA